MLFLMKVNPEAIRAERLASGLTQEVLARRAGLSRALVQLVEQGRANSVRPNTIGALVKILGCTVADIAEAETDAEAAALARQAERAEAS